MKEIQLRRDSRMTDSSSKVDDTMTWYDTIAPSYDELYGDEQLRKYKHIFMVIQTRGNVSCGNRKYLVAIDVGCGTSLLAKELSRLFSPKIYYVGIDISSNLLEIAKDRVDSLNIMADLIAGDASNLPFRDRVADAIFSISVFRCEDPVDNLIREAQRLCKDTGVLAFTIVCGKGVRKNECRGNPTLLYESVIRDGRELIQVIKCR